MKDNILDRKCKAFAVRIVHFYKFLVNTQKEIVLSKQILRSGTSIGANIAEAQQAQSRPDFVAKLSISLKETSETIYWLRLLEATDYLTKAEFDSIISDTTRRVYGNTSLSFGNIGLIALQANLP